MENSTKKKPKTTKEDPKDNIVVILEDKDKPAYAELLTKFKDLKQEEELAQKALVDAMAGRNLRVDKCVQACSKSFADSFKAYNMVKERTNKDKMSKISMK